MLLHPLVAPADEGSDRRRRSVENVDPILVDDSPEAIGLRPIRRAFVHQGGSAIRERSVDDVAMTRDPAYIGGAPKQIVVAQIENVFRRRIDADEISAGGMKNAL